MQTALINQNPCLGFLSQNRRDLAIMAEVSGWLFSFWRVAEDFRKDSCFPKLVWGAVHSRQGGTKEIWGDSCFQTVHSFFVVVKFKWPTGSLVFEGISRPPTCHLSFVPTAGWWLHSHLYCDFRGRQGREQNFVKNHPKCTNRNFIRKQISLFPPKILKIIF